MSFVAAPLALKLANNQHAISSDVELVLVKVEANQQAGKPQGFQKGFPLGRIAGMLTFVGTALNHFLAIKPEPKRAVACTVCSTAITAAAIEVYLNCTGAYEVGCVKW